MADERVTILIVDDRPENLVAVEAVLDSLPVTPVRANSGEEALVQVLKHDFALILMDAQMPVMDGYEAAALIRSRERSARTPIIFVTAIDKSQTQVFKGYAAGAVDFIFKPFEPEVLRSKVMIFIEIYNHKRELAAQAERLRISEERYALAAAGAADGLWDWDLKTNKVYYSPRWAEIANYTGHAPDDSIEAWWNRVDPHDLPRLTRAMEHYFQGRTDHFEEEHRLMIAPGEERWVLARGLAVRDIDNQPLRMAGSLSDITARKRAEAEARQQERLATVGMTIAQLSHSMKNIFTVLSGAIGLVERMIDPRNSELHMAFGMIQSSAQRLRMIVMNMLDFSKEREPLREPVSLPDLFDELRSLMHPAAEKKGSELEFFVESGAETIMHDGERLMHSLLNLGTNALDALNKEGGRVWFRAIVGNRNTFNLTDEAEQGSSSGGGEGGEGREDDVLLIEISDNGCGIPHDHLEKIFEPFFSTKASRGTGLGLPSVRQFVNEAGGILRVRSEQNVGTVFQMFFFDCLTLPDMRAT